MNEDLCRILVAPKQQTNSTISRHGKTAFLPTRFTLCNHVSKVIYVEVTSKIFWVHVQLKEFLTIAKFYKIIWTEATFDLSITDVGFLCAEPLTHFTLNLFRGTVTVGAILTSCTSVITFAAKKTTKAVILVCSIKLYPSQQINN